MKKITILIVLALLCPFLRASAQRRYSTPPLKVGDTIPDLTIHNVVNFKTKSIRLADYRDKLLIIDFWGTLCIPCVKHLPEIYALQKRYADHVFFLPVDIDAKYDPPAKVIAFFKERKKSFDLPSVVADTVLRKLFQPPYLGYYVWIKNGVVQQITDTEEITSANIEKAIADQSQDLRLADRPNPDYQTPFFEKGNDAPKPAKFFMRSMLLPYSPTLGQAGWQTDSTGKVFRVSLTPMSMFSLLLAAYPAYAHFGNRVKKLVTDPELLRDNLDTDSLRRKFMYAYEAIFPPVSIQKAVNYVHEDLVRYLPYKLDSTLVKDTCWVLKLSNKKRLKYGDLKLSSSTNIEDNLGLPIYFYNKHIDLLRSLLEEKFKIPVLNETGYHANIFLDLPGDLGNIKKLQESLFKQGLILSRELRAVQYLVIKDKSQND